MNFRSVDPDEFWGKEGLKFKPNDIIERVRVTTLLDKKLEKSKKCGNYSYNY